MQFFIDSGGLKMSNSIKRIGKSLIRAGMLETTPLCVYFHDEIPQDAVPMVSVDKCAAKAILTAAMDENTPTLYMGRIVSKAFVWEVLLGWDFQRNYHPTSNTLYPLGTKILQMEMLNI